MAFEQHPGVQVWVTPRRFVVHAYEDRIARVLGEIMPA